MHPRLKYKIINWTPRALRFARTLQGVPITVHEINARTRDPEFGLFMLSGILPEKQYYIDASIRMLEEFDPTSEKSLCSMMVVAIRVLWSAEELLGKD